MAYDWLKGRHPSRAAKEYLGILHLAAMENEAAVDGALRVLIDEELPISIEAVQGIVCSEGGIVEEIVITSGSPWQGENDIN
jgi:hypothetical protein